MAEPQAEVWTVKRVKDAISRTETDKTAGSVVNEILPGVFLGERAAAEDAGLLRELGVTHVLCCCSQDRDIFQLELALRKARIAYLGIPATSFTFFDLTPWFQPAAHYIDTALASQGKVLVHCHRGVNRSASIFIAFLMLSHRLTGGGCTAREVQALH